MKRKFFLAIMAILTPFILFGQEPDVNVEEVCLGNASQLVVVNIPSGTSSIGWDLNNDGFYSDAIGEQINHAFSNPGSYPISIRITLETQEELFYNNIASAVVNPIPVGDFIVQNSCQFSPSVFISYATVSTGSISTYEWDLDNDGEYDISTANNEHELIFDNYGSYDISNRIISEAGCETVVDKQIEIFEKPEAQFSYQNTCMLDSTTFINETSIETGSITYAIWKFGDGTQTSDLENVEHVYRQSGIFNATLIVVSNNFCSDTIVKEVDIKPIPEFEFQFDSDTSVLYEGNAVSVDLSNSYTTILWNDGSSQLPKIIESTGEFLLKATDDNGCSSEKSFQLYFKEVKDLELVSNVFLLNGDDLYETFEVNDKVLYQGYKLYVFNQYGMEIYSNANYNNDWDFTYEGNKLETGTYFYIIDFGGKITKGNFNIIKP